MKRRSTGQSLVETALILAAFMGLLLGMVELGEMLFSRQTLADRVHEAARWGALNAYDAASIRNVVLYGAARPEREARPWLGLSPEAVAVTNPGCPGETCRISVAIPTQGLRDVEPVEFVGAIAAGVSGAAASRP